MDLHKKTSSFCAMNEEGNILKETKVATIPDEVGKFIRSFGKKDKLKLVLEPISQGAFYADYIESLGVEVHLAHPKKVKAIASARIKTDRIDAQVLAHLLRSNLLPESYHAPLSVRLLKEQARGRLSLVANRTRLKNKVHGILFRNGIIYSKTTLFTKQGREWMKGLSLKEEYRHHLDALLSLIDGVNDQIKTLEKYLKQTVEESEQMKLLKTIPGIGDVTALTILSEIGDINRFPHQRNLQSYAGLVPSVRTSGGHSQYGNITKEGSTYLRYVMVEVAHHQLLLKRKYVGLKWYYQRLALRKNNQTAAVATARKLLTVVFKVLKEKRPFEERLPKTISIISST